MPRHVQRTPITPIQSQAITAGWAGLALLLLALVTWYATGVRSWYITALLVVAGLALADWLVYASPLVLERFSRRQLLAGPQRRAGHRAPPRATTTDVRGSQERPSHWVTPHAADSEYLFVVASGSVL